MSLKGFSLILSFPVTTRLSSVGDVTLNLSLGLR